MIHRSQHEDIEIPDVSIAAYVTAKASATPDKPALIDGTDGRTITYAQLAGGIASLAGGLAARGFGKGDVLALIAPNIPEYAIVFHGTAMAGGIVTTVNPTYTDREIHHQLTDSGARILVTIPMFLETARAAAEGTAVEDIFVLGAAEGAKPISELFGVPLSEPVPVSGDDVVALPYSSGTTGLAKGVELTHRNLVANIAQCLAMSSAGADDRVLAVLPFFHIYGMQVLMNMTLVLGATVVTLPRFDLEQFLTAHQQYEISYTYVAPPIVVALAKHPIVDKFDLHSLQLVTSGAAPLSGDLAQEASARLGCEVVQGYGMTELSPVSHMTPHGYFKPGSVGVLVPNTEARIIDVADGAELGIDEDGEVWIRGPQVMKGYLNNAEATTATIDDDGWLHTGDIGHIDADGHLYVVDRLKELIKYKGFQVPPAELEGLLLSHPAVADSAVIGLPDEEAGEIPVGFVVLKPGVDAAVEEIMAFVAGQVAHYKELRALHVVDAIPKSAAGKILRRVLKDQASG